MGTKFMLDWVRSSYNSMRGRVVSNWRRGGGKLEIEVEIPVNATALIYVPARAIKQATESGWPIERARGVEFVRIDRDAVVFRIGSGRYAFTADSP